MSDNTLKSGNTADDLNIISTTGNKVIQVVNKVYSEDDLKKLVISSFKDLADLEDFWSKTFPKAVSQLGHQESGLQYEALLNGFKQNDGLALLLGEIKKRNPAEYRTFLANQALSAVGLSAEQMPSDINRVERELQGLQSIVFSQQKEISDVSLDFEDRTGVFEKIRQCRENHIVLYGSAGVGKSYLLQHFQETNLNNSRFVFIDLNSCKPEDILAKSIEQLGGNPSKGYRELAKIIHNLLNGTPRINRFYFLFDNADQNQAAIDYLFCPDNIVENPKLNLFLNDWGLLDSIQLKIVMVAQYPVRPSTIYPSFSNAVQIKIDSLSRHSVKNMLERIIYKKHIPVPFELVSELSDEIYYLTGGHPKCTTQMLIALAERDFVRPTDDEWELLYRENVVATIHAKMLKPIDPELMPTIWSLCIFRRFDQRLLGRLLDLGILSNLPGDKSRQARDLRSKLEEIILFEREQTTSTITTNYVMRHALLFDMQHIAPNLYTTLNSIALEIFLDRFQSSEFDIEKQVVNLFEIIYHWIKLLKVELGEENFQSGARSVYERIVEGLKNYLQMTLTMIQNENHPAFFRFLVARWQEDWELQESIRKITKREVHLEELIQVITKKDEFAFVNRMAGDTTTDAPLPDMKKKKPKGK